MMKSCYILYNVGYTFLDGVEIPMKVDSRDGIIVDGDVVHITARDLYNNGAKYNVLSCGYDFRWTFKKHFIQRCDYECEIRDIK